MRFYERRRRLEEPARKASGYRRYGDDTVAVPRFIRRAKVLGFIPREIKALLGLRLDAGATRADVRSQAAAKIADIGARVRDLQWMRDALTGLVNVCRGDGPAEGGPILQTMNQADDATAAPAAPARPRRVKP